MRPLAFAAICAVVIAGCGGGGDESDSSSTTVVETAQPLPKLPPGWRPVVNRVQGFAFGLPPGWKAGVTRPGTSLLRTPDRRVAVSISADRTDQAISQPLGDYAAGVANSVGGLKRITVIRTAPFPHRYKAVRVLAKGVGAGAVKERVFLVALRRDHLATFVVLAVRRAAVPGALYGAQVRRIVTTLRSRPPG